jgi:hypothetical protein
MRLGWLKWQRVEPDMVEEKEKIIQKYRNGTE